MKKIYVVRYCGIPYDGDTYNDQIAAFEKLVGLTLVLLSTLFGFGLELLNNF